MGNENTALGFSHENSKYNAEKAYIRTCPSVMQKMKRECSLSTAKKGYHKKIMTDHPPFYQAVFQPKNYQQVENLCNKVDRSKDYCIIPYSIFMS